VDLESNCQTQHDSGFDHPNVGEQSVEIGRWDLGAGDCEGRQSYLLQQCQRRAFDEDRG
jgi:hypothetical protein